MIQERILDLTDYALVTGLIDPQDTRYTINRLLELFGLDELEDAVAEAHQATIKTQEDAEDVLEAILNDMTDYAYENGIMAENSIVYRDLFDTKIMGLLVARPGEVVTLSLIHI